LKEIIVTVEEKQHVQLPVFHYFVTYSIYGKKSAKINKEIQQMKTISKQHITNRTETKLLMGTGANFSLFCQAAN